MKLLLATMLAVVTGLGYAAEQPSKKEEMRLPAKKKAETTDSTKKVENTKK